MQTKMLTRRARLSLGKIDRGVTVCSLKERADLGDFVVFCSDGQSTEAFASEYFRASGDGRCWFVGADCSLEHRNAEYVAGRDPERFEEHEVFFTQTVPDWAWSFMGIRLSRERTAVFGYSCGGAFAVSIGMLHRDLFGIVFPFSVAGRPVADFSVDPPAAVAGVRFHFRSGSREPGGMRSYMARLAKWLGRGGAIVDISVLPGGHEFSMWSKALNESLGKAVSGVQ